MSEPLSIRVRADVEQRLRAIAEAEGNHVSSVARRVLMAGFATLEAEQPHRAAEQRAPVRA